MEYIREAGWTEMSSKYNMDGKLVHFEKGNFIVSVISLLNDTAILRFIAKDATLIEWMHDPENFRITIR